MNTTIYNPSPLEVEFADIIHDLKETINGKLKNSKIIDMDKNTNIDNPLVKITLEDKDGDKHMVIMKIIQKPDAMF